MPQFKHQTKRPVAAPGTEAVPVETRTATAPRPLSSIGRLVAFVYAGCVGFGVDMLGTLTLINFGLNRPIARALAMAAALLATYALNRGITFRRDASRTRRGMVREGANYAVVGIATGFLNWAVFTLAIAIVPDLNTIVAVVFSSLVAMAVSYVGYSKFAFRG